MLPVYSTDRNNDYIPRYLKGSWLGSINGGLTHVFYQVCFSAFGWLSEQHTMKKPESVNTPFNSYTIKDKKGEGGSGVVYSAVDESERDVAIKFLKPERATADKKKRFKNEFIFCWKSEHPNIVSVLDSGIHDGDTLFFVMPLYDGSIRNVIDSLNSAEKLELFLCMLDGIEAAHLGGIIHRALKPENVLSNADASDVVITDFGIARFDDDELFTAVETKKANRLANFQYRAPEQLIRGQKVGPGTDIYAAGLILNELYTGKIPAGTEFDLIGAVESDFAYLDSIVGQMLRQKMDDRFPSIEEVKQEIIKEGKVHATRQKISKLNNLGKL